jgi:hypothetical protein
MASHYNEVKRAEAIEYLRSRNKYILDRCKFVPTPAANTDVKTTWLQYLADKSLEDNASH